MDKMSVYLDNAATTKPCEEAVDAAVKMMRENYGNPSSLHRAGLDAQLVVHVCILLPELQRAITSL